MKLVEHKLPIKGGYRPVKQARRRMSMETELKVKEEIERLVKAGFITPAIYADWLANIVTIQKRKVGVVRICVDYRNLNEASPKYEYPMPMADMLVDGAAHNQMLSFMDGNAGYNQIMVAEEDIHKTALMCLRHIGALEYTVMPFGLRNAGATYQRAMNSVFHDMIVHLTPWKLYFDGSKTDKASRVGIVLKDPLGIRHCHSFQLDFQCTNNKAEYKVLIIGLEILAELGIQCVEVLGDSMLVLKQIAEEHKCLNPSLAIYLVATKNLLTEFMEATWEHIPREGNSTANEMAQIATRVQMPEDCVQRIIKVGKKSLPSVLTRGMEIDVNYAIITEDDWRTHIINYLHYPTLPYEKRVRIMALNYLMWNGDLVRKSEDELLLRCLGKKEYMKVMGETHEGIYGAHQGGRKMYWLNRRYGYFWPTIMKDCIEYSKGSTNYFIKCVEAKPVKTTTSQEIITFIEEQIIQRQILGLAAYRLQDRDRDVHAAPINGKWLKKFYPTMWDSEAVQTDPGIEE
ncbi:hypothetical protein L3X38_041863 [Prunus dulcis]|uniref:RNase H type-1 domain-containing protein n=1 Tax=Prunus dulcis TaxID=3755 RepID=A0AAD4UTU6_PRUDU|nr:hypothetical protein L3X38_041863 [Prunus dulcis]